MYVLDEPSIGLHQRDNDRLIATLKHLRDIGNSVIVVEHDEDMMRAPTTWSSTWAQALACTAGAWWRRARFDAVRQHPQSLTGQYLAGTWRIAVPARRTPWLPVVAAPAPGRPSHAPVSEAAARRAHGRTRGAPGSAGRCAGRHGQQPPGRERGLPVGLLTCVTGVSGRARARWSTTRCTRPWRRQLSTAPTTNRRRTRHRGHRAFRQGHQRGPVAHRPHAAQQPGHLHRPVHAHPRADGRGEHRARTRLRPGALPSTWRAGAAKPARATAW